MQIIINDKKEITTVATIGTVGGGIDCVIPDDVLNDNPLSYKYIDGNFVKNPDYKPPTPPETVDMEQMLLDQDFRLSMLEINM